jgi:hypothetical protein
VTDPPAFCARPFQTRPFQASIDQQDSADRIDPTLAAEPTDSTDPIEPTEPTDRIEPADPIDKMDPAEPIDKIDPLEPMLRMEPSRLAMESFSQLPHARRRAGITIALILYRMTSAGVTRSAK